MNLKLHLKKFGFQRLRIDPQDQLQFKYSILLYAQLQVFKKPF